MKWTDLSWQAKTLAVILALQALLGAFMVTDGLDMPAWLHGLQNALTALAGLFLHWTGTNAALMTPPPDPRPAKTGGLERPPDGPASGSSAGGSSSPASGFAIIDVLVALLPAIVIGFVLAWTLQGCALSWPRACERVTNADGTRTMRCRCQVYTHTISRSTADMPAPAGVESQTCDGEPMPIEVHAQNVGLPRCQP